MALHYSDKTGVYRKSSQKLYPLSAEQLGTHRGNPGYINSTARDSHKWEQLVFLYKLIAAIPLPEGGCRTLNGQPVLGRDPYFNQVAMTPYMFEMDVGPIPQSYKLFHAAAAAEAGLPVFGVAADVADIRDFHSSVVVVLPAVVAKAVEDCRRDMHPFSPRRDYVGETMLNMHLLAAEEVVADPKFRLRVVPSEEGYWPPTVVVERK